MTRIRTTNKETTTSAPPKPQKERRANGDTSVRTRSDGRIEVRVSMPDGTRRSVYGKTRKEAQAKARELQRQAEQGTYVRPARETLAEHARLWVTRMRSQWEDGTYLNQQGHVEKHIIPTLGHLRLQQVTPDDIERFYHTLEAEKQLAASTIRQIHTTLRMIFKQAVKARKVFINPIDGVLPPPNKARSKPRYLTAKEIERIVETANDHRHGCLFLLAVMTGMRRNELLALKWSDIDWKESIIHLQRALSYHNVDHTGRFYKEKTPKSETSQRAILLPTCAIEALHLHQMKQEEQRAQTKPWHDLGLVFPNRQGLHQSPGTVHYGFKQFLKRIGVADAHLHATRHGHATYLLESGVYAGVVQERLGHSNVAFTMQFYGHVTPKMQQQAIALLDHRFGNAEHEMKDQPMREIPRNL